MKKIMIILLATLFFIPSWSYPENELEDITVKNWFDYLNSHEKYETCGLWSKSFYKNSLFSDEATREIQKNPNTSFDKIIDICQTILEPQSLEKMGIKRDSEKKAKDIITSIYREIGLLKPDLAIWE